MNIQKGGLDPLLKVPTFKYTMNIQRKGFINVIYPYSVYFLDTLNKIDFSSYSYDGACEYIIAKVDNDQQFTPSEEIIVSDYEDILQVTNQITITSYSQNSPKCYYFGGTVYEILNKKFTNPDLHRYCDATGDIDVEIIPPKLPIYIDEKGRILDYEVHFLTKDYRINTFYRNFTVWCFNNIINKIEKLEYLIRQMEFESFELTDYHEFPPEKYRNEQFGYLQHEEKIGNVKIIGFVTTPDITMYKIQVIGKVGEYIDHFIEYVLLINPEALLSRRPQFETVEINRNYYNIQNFGHLISANIKSYEARVSLYDTTNTFFIHKPINHVARLLYLFELFYQNQELFADFLTSLESYKLIIIKLFNYKNGTTLEDYLNYTGFLKYYKIVGNSFRPINIEVKFLLYAYFTLLKKNINELNHFVFHPPALMRNEREALKELTYSNYFDDIGVERPVRRSDQYRKMTPECIKEHEDRFKAIHDLFIEKLFDGDPNDIIYTPPGIPTTMCGGKRNVRKIRKTYKKINNKKTYKRKTYKRKQLYKKKKTRNNDKSKTKKRRNQ